MNLGWFESSLAQFCFRGNADFSLSQGAHVLLLFNAKPIIISKTIMAIKTPNITLRCFLIFLINDIAMISPVFL